MKPRLKILAGEWYCYDGTDTASGPTFNLAYIRWLIRKTVRLQREYR